MMKTVRNQIVGSIRTNIFYLVFNANILVIKF